LNQRCGAFVALQALVLTAPAVPALKPVQQLKMLSTGEGRALAHCALPNNGRSPAAQTPGACR